MARVTGRVPGPSELQFRQRPHPAVEPEEWGTRCQDFTLRVPTRIRHGIRESGSRIC